MYLKVEVYGNEDEMNNLIAGLLYHPNIYSVSKF